MSERTGKLKSAVDSLVASVVTVVMTRLDDLLDGDGITVTIRRARPEDSKSNKVVRIEQNQQASAAQWEILPMEETEASDG